MNAQHNNEDPWNGPATPPHRPPPPIHAFTRLDLLALLAVIAVLAALARPSFGHGSRSDSLVCMDNMRRLAGAWTIHAADHDGTFVGNYHGGLSSGQSWTTGWLDWSTRGANTNTLFLTDPKYSALSPYLQNASVYKCPADTYLSRRQRTRGWSKRVRSYSMNCYIGPGNARTGPVSNGEFLQGFQSFTRFSPERAIVFLEEHPDSINDAMFFHQLTGSRWVDFPSSLHNGSAWFAMADGHVELRKWENPATIAPVRFSHSVIWTATTEDDPDLLWLRKRFHESTSATDAP